MSDHGGPRSGRSAVDDERRALVGDRSAQDDERSAGDDERSAQDEESDERDEETGERDGEQSGRDDEWSVREAVRRIRADDRSAVDGEHPAPHVERQGTVHVREGGEDVDWRALSGPTVGEDLLPDNSFALCLTHDVDRPYKRVQALYNALSERDPQHLRALIPGREPNWQFDELLGIEEDLGVRSAFYFLNEQRLLRDRSPRDWLDPQKWRLYADRYSLTDPAIVDLVQKLDDGGWEVGLHGSYESYDDRTRLQHEKDALEAVLGHEVVGGRHHYLNRRLPETWEHHVSIDLQYDATLGSSSTYGFDYGDSVLRPFGDEFVVFPLTMMEIALPDPETNFERAWQECERLLQSAADRGAIATVLWHPRMFNQRDWPGYAELYRRLIERALELGAWVGPPRDLYGELDHDVADQGGVYEGAAVPPTSSADQPGTSGEQ